MWWPHYTVIFDWGQLVHLTLCSLGGIDIKKVLLKATGTHPN